MAPFVTESERSRYFGIAFCLITVFYLLTATNLWYRKLEGETMEENSDQIWAQAEIRRRVSDLLLHEIQQEFVVYAKVDYAPMSATSLNEGVKPRIIRTQVSVLIGGSIGGENAERVIADKIGSVAKLEAKRGDCLTLSVFEGPIPDGAWNQKPFDRNSPPRNDEGTSFVPRRQ